MINKKGQLSFEMAVVLTVVAAALAAMSGTIQSFIMGGWFSSAKQLGEPYNLETTGTITNVLVSNTLTNVNTINNGESAYSLRIDMGDSTDLKSGTLTVPIQ